MSKPSDKRLANAKHRREHMIARLQLCTCAYPIDVYRNGSGHSNDCPVHVLYMKEREERDDS